MEELKNLLNKLEDLTEEIIDCVVFNFEDDEDGERESFYDRLHDISTIIYELINEDMINLKEEKEELE